MNKPKLNMMQNKFITAYLQCWNGTKAAIEAGYSPKTAGKQAYQLMQHPEIKRIIEKTRPDLEKSVEDARSEIVIAHGVSFDWKASMLQNIILSQLDSNPDVAIKAVAELNKMQGHYAPESTINLNVNENREIKEIQEIRKMYKREY